MIAPAAARDSQAFGVDLDQQVGQASIFPVNRAMLWTGSPTTWIDLHPKGAASSQAFGVALGQQVGWADFGAGPRAGMWIGSAASWVDLHPHAASESMALDTDGIQQVGIAKIGNFQHASVWNGSAESWIDLHPIAGTEWSRARIVSGGYQFGTIKINSMHHACVWRGTAESWVDLHPPEALGSGINDTDGENAVGEVYVTEWRAAIWNDLGSAMTNLHPSTAKSSYAQGIRQGVQAGYIRVDGNEQDRACAWFGTPDSIVDLHAVLNGYEDSAAYDVTIHEGTIYIVGRARRPTTNSYDAIMWTRALDSCPADCDASGSLSIDDFVCFQTRFVLGEPSADCDSNGTLTIDDFVCFQAAFSLGC